MNIEPNNLLIMGRSVQYAREFWFVNQLHAKFPWHPGMYLSQVESLHGKRKTVIIDLGSSRVTEGDRDFYLFREMCAVKENTVLQPDEFLKLLSGEES